MTGAWLVLSSLLGLMALAGLLLSVPIGLAFRLRGVEGFQAGLKVRWLFGLVRLDFRWPRPGIGPSPVPGQPPPAPGRGPSHEALPHHRRQGGHAGGLHLLGDAALRRNLARLARGMDKAAHLRRLSLRVRVGLDDPADTGRLWGLLGPLSAVAQHRQDVGVRIEPEFSAAVLEFDARGQASLVPLRFLVLVVAFALSPATIGAWRRSRGAGGG